MRNSIEGSINQNTNQIRQNLNSSQSNKLTQILMESDATKSIPFYIQMRNIIKQLNLSYSEKKQINAILNQRQLSSQQMEKKIKAIISHKSSVKQQKLLGGGCGASKSGEKAKEEDKFREENQQLPDQDFIETYNWQTDKKQVIENIVNDNQLECAKLLLEQSIFKYSSIIKSNITLYKPYILELFETYFIYSLTAKSAPQIEEIENENQQTDFVKILQEFQNLIRDESNDQQCEDILFITNMIDIHFNQSKKSNQTQIDEEFTSNVKQLVLIILKLRITQTCCLMEKYDENLIKQLINKVSNHLSSNQIQQKECILQYSLQVLIEKVQQFKERMWEISLNEELLLYINLFNSRINVNSAECSKIIMNLIRIDQILFRFMNDFQFFQGQKKYIKQFVNSLLEQENQIKVFLNVLQLDSLNNSNLNKEFVEFALTNSCYNQLSVSIQLKFKFIFDKTNLPCLSNERLCLGLVHRYLLENQKPVQSTKPSLETKLVIESNPYFMNLYQLYSKEKQISQTLINYDSERKKSLTELGIDTDKFEIRMKSLEQIQQLITLNSVSKWERDIKHKQTVSILRQHRKQQKINLPYVNQSIRFVEGINILKGISQENMIENRNGVEDIINYFLKEDQSSILVLSADNGMGKTTLLQKLEYILKDNLNRPRSQDLTKNYLPLFIKAQQLSKVSYSLDRYLQTEGMDENLLNYLKNSDDNKVILIDRFEECSKQQYSINRILNTQQWRNTKYVLSIRKEYLGEYNIINLLSNKQWERKVALVELDQLRNQSIVEYLKKYVSIKSKNSADLQEKLTLRSQELLSNRKIKELIKIPFNLYKLASLLSHETIQFDGIQYSTDIYELFYSYKFEKQAQKFAEPHFKLDKNLMFAIKNSYFEYYQNAAMQIFIHKDQNNSLEADKSKLKFQFNELVKKSVNCQFRPMLLQWIETYHDNGINQLDNLIHFKHLTLYHYFVARALKYDFSQHESIYSLSICQLKQFNINKKLFVNHKLSSSQDSPIIQNFYHLLQREIISRDFMSTYSNSNISEAHKYIQYLKMSKIKRCSEISEIDVGASNLLSTLFINNFSYSNLDLRQCSFSRAYIPQQKDLSICFSGCNLSQAYLRGSNLSFISSNTQNAYFDCLPKVFDTQNIYNFNSICFTENNSIYSITSTGFINIFELINSSYSLKQSKQITSSPLSKLFVQKGNLVVSSLDTIFIIDAQSLEITYTYRFSKKIQDIVYQNNKDKDYLVTLVDGCTYRGNVQQCFTQILANNSYLSISHNSSYLAATHENSVKIYGLESSFNVVHKIEDQHYDSITCLSFSRDSKLLATASQDFTCKLWNTEKNYEQVISLEEFTSSIIQIAFSPDNKHLFAISQDRRCRIYSLENKIQLVSSLLVNMKFTAHLSFSLDNKYIGIACDDNTCKIYHNEKDFPLFYQISGHNYFLNSAQFSNNSKYLITSSQDQISRLWSIENNFKLQNKVYDIQSAILFKFSVDSIYLAAAFKDSSVKVWNVEKGFSCIKSIAPQVSNEILQIQFSFNCKHLSIVYKSGTITVHSLEKEQYPILTILEEPSQSLKVYFSSDNKRMIVMPKVSSLKLYNLYNSEGGIVKLQNQVEIEQSLYSTNSQDSNYFAFTQNKICKLYYIDQDISEVANLAEHTHNLNLVVFSKNREYLATSSVDKSVILWNLINNYTPMYQFTPHEDVLCSMVFASNSQYFITTSKDQSCSIWNVCKGFSLSAKLHSNTDIFSNVSISNESKYLALGTNRHTYQIFNIESIQVQIRDQFNQKNCGHTHTVTSLCYSVDGNYLATASWDKSFKVWDVKQGYQLIKTVQEHSDPINAIDFSSDSKLFASVSVDKSCKIWDVSDNFELKANLASQDCINAVKFSLDQKYLILTSWDDTIKIYDVENEFSLLKTLTNHSKLVTSVVFSNDGEYLVSTSDDKTIKIFSVSKNFTLLNTLTGHTKSVNSARFSHKNLDLATVSKDCTCKIWDGTNKFQLKATLKGHSDQVSQCVYSPDDQYLITSSWDNTCKMWSTSNNYQLLNTLQAHEYPITQIAFSPDQMYLVTCSVDNSTKLWLTRNALQIFSYLSSLNVDFSKSQACFSKDRKYLLIQSVCIWTIIQVDKGIISEQGKGEIDVNILKKYYIDLFQLKDFDKLNLYDCSFQI